MLPSPPVTRVLVLDDDPLILSVVAGILTTAGFDVVATTDPDAVLELALQQRPAAAVLDVRMPGRSGLDVLRSLRECPELEGLRTLVMSARHSDRALGFEAGADGYLPKPFDARELLGHLRAIAREGFAEPPAGAQLS